MFWFRSVIDAAAWCAGAGDALGRRLRAHGVGGGWRSAKRSPAWCAETRRPEHGAVCIFGGAGNGHLSGALAMCRWSWSQDCDRRRSAGRSGSKRWRRPRWSDRPVVAGGDRCRRRVLAVFLARRAHLPFAQRRPAVVVGAAQDGGVANGYAGCLGFIDNAVIERHGLRRGFVDAGVLEAAFVQNGDGNDVRGNDAGRVRGDLKHGGGTQLVGLATLAPTCAVNSRSTYQHKRSAGQKLSSAI